MSNPAKSLELSLDLVKKLPDNVKIHAHNFIFNYFNVLDNIQNAPIFVNSLSFLLTLKHTNPQIFSKAKEELLNASLVDDTPQFGYVSLINDRLEKMKHDLAEMINSQTPKVEVHKHEPAPSNNIHQHQSAPKGESSKQHIPQKFDMNKQPTPSSKSNPKQNPTQVKVDVHKHEKFNPQETTKPGSKKRCNTTTQKGCITITKKRCINTR
ncbi:hypothetical protein QTN25_001433 [Entamoeba marina]